MGQNWIPDSCSLSHQERSERLTEFDVLLGRASARVRLSAVQLTFALPPESESEARDLVAREIRCCSFFTFSFQTAERLELTISVPDEHVTILDRIERRLTMNDLIKNYQSAMIDAEQNKPKVGGFPYLAEALRQEGAVTNTWQLPSCQCIFQLKEGNIVIQGEPLVSGWVEVPSFNEAALVAAIRTDQAGDSTFPEFLQSAWQAGVTNYVVDFEARTVAYYGAQGESYTESYPAISSQ